MSTTANIGYGSTLKYGSTAVAQVVDITGPAIKVDAVDVSNQGSPQVGSNKSAWREKIPGLSDPGSITFNLVYIKAAVTALFGLIAATQTWNLTFPDGAIWSCSGFITELKDGTPLDDRMTVDVTIELTGTPTFT